VQRAAFAVHLRAAVCIQAAVRSTACRRRFLQVITTMAQLFVPLDEAVRHLYDVNSTMSSATILQLPLVL